MIRIETVQNLVLQGFFADYKIKYVSGLIKSSLVIDGDQNVLSQIQQTLSKNTLTLTGSLPNSKGDYAKDSLSHRQDKYYLNGHLVDETYKLRIVLELPSTGATLHFGNITMGNAIFENGANQTKLYVAGMVNTTIPLVSDLTMFVSGCSAHCLQGVTKQLDLALSGTITMNVGLLSGRQEINLNGSNTLTINGLDGTHELNVSGANTINCMSVNQAKTLMQIDGSNPIQYMAGAFSEADVYIHGAGSMSLPQVGDLNLRAEGAPELAVNGNIKNLTALLKDCAQIRVNGSIENTKIVLKDVSSIKARSYGTILKKEVAICATMK